MASAANATAANALRTAAGRSTWVRQKNVDRHPGYNVTDHDIPGDDDMSVAQVLTPVLKGLTAQSTRMYDKKGTCTLSFNETGLSVSLVGSTGSKPEIKMDIPVEGVADVKLKMDAAYVLAQYVTSRLCHGIGDYFLETLDHTENWNGISDDITLCIRLICAIEKPADPPQTQETKERPAADKQFGESVLEALKNPRLTDKIEIAKWTKFITDWLGAGIELPVRTRVDIREIACDKVAVYAKERPMTDPNHKLTKLAGSNGYEDANKRRLTINMTEQTIEWLTHMNTKVTYGPFKNIIDNDRSNTGLMDAMKITGTPTNIPQKLAVEKAGGLTYDAVRTLASGVNVVLFGFGNSGTGKSFSLFGEKAVSSKPAVDGALQLILRQMQHVQLLHVFEEVPGGGIKDTKYDDHPNYDGRIIRLFDCLSADKKSRPHFELKPTAASIPDGCNPVSVLDNRTDKEIFADRTRAGFGPGGHTNKRGSRLVAAQEPQNPNTVDGIIEYVNNIIEYRKTQLRIRATLNNGQSSRSHMYIVINVWCGDATPPAAATARLCIIDLGGMEQPASMLNHAKTAVDTKMIDLDSTNDKSIKNTILQWRFTSRVSSSEADRTGKFSLGMIQTVMNMILNIYASAPKSQKGTITDVYGGKLLLSDWVTAYMHVADLFLSGGQRPNDKDLKTKLKADIAALIMCDELKPLSKVNSASPFEVMYPREGFLVLLKPPQVSADELVPGNYYSLLHLAALYVEGCYINESLTQVKEFLQNKCPSRNQTVLTRRIMSSITTGKTRYIMLFTMCSTKLQADIDPANPAQFDNDFMIPANFVQDVCSTAYADASV
jgi:hypothetical protein